MSRSPSGRGITKRAPHDQRAEDFAHRDVETGRGDLQQTVGVVDPVFVAEPDEILGDGCVWHRQHLGQPGGTRGIDQVGGVLWAQRSDQLGGRGGRIVCRVGNRFAHHQFGVRILEDEGQPVLRVGGIHRQVHPARFEHPECGDDQLGRLVQQHRDAILGADALLDEPVRHRFDSSSISR